MAGLGEDTAIIEINSVTGDRNGVWNYIYGAAKTGCSEYLSGLATRRDRPWNRNGKHRADQLCRPLVIDLSPAPVSRVMGYFGICDRCEKQGALDPSEG